MRKVFKGIALALGIALAIAVLGAVVLWRQATALPAWYAAEASEERTSEETPQNSPPIAPPSTGTPTLPAAPPGWVALQDDAIPPDANTKASAPKPSRRPSSRHELRGFHLRSGVAPDKTAVKASRALLDGDKLEAGVVLDLSRVPLSALPERDRTLMQRAIAGFPGLLGRDVYVGIEDRPVTREGVLQLGRSPRLRVGNLRYSLESAASKLGMSPETLRQELDRELRRLEITDPKTR